MKGTDLQGSFAHRSAYPTLWVCSLTVRPGQTIVSTCRRPSLTLRTPARQVAGELKLSAAPHSSSGSVLLLLWLLLCWCCLLIGDVVRSAATHRCCAPAAAGRRSCTVQAVRQRNTSSDRAVQAAEESTEEFQVKLNETIDKLKVSMTAWYIVAAGCQTPLPAQMRRS